MLPVPFFFKVNLKNKYQYLTICSTNNNKMERDRRARSLARFFVSNFVITRVVVFGTWSALATFVYKSNLKALYTALLFTVIMLYTNFLVIKQKSDRLLRFTQFHLIQSGQCPTASFGYNNTIASTDTLRRSRN